MTALIRKTALTLAVVASIALLSACGSKETAEGQSDSNAATEDTSGNENKFWDPALVKAALDADRGEKSIVVCTTLASDRFTSYGVAEAMPSAGIEKRSDTDMAIPATSADAAEKALRAGWKGAVRMMEDLDVRRCVREHNSSEAKHSERPESAYQDIDALRSIYLYYAVSGEKPPYETLANNWRGFSGMRDAFEKRDRLVEITAEINAGIERAKANPYAWIEFQSKLPEFDFSSGTYPLEKVLGPRTYITPSGDGFSGYPVMFVQRDTFAEFRPESDTRARELEALISDGMRQHLVRVYGKVEAAENRDGRPTVMLSPTKVSVVQPERWDIKNPQKLFEIVAQ